MEKEQLIKQVHEEKHFRNLRINRESINTESRTIEISFSSEEPYERYWGNEILDHSDGSVRLDRLNNAGPALVDHDTGELVGVVEKAWIGDDHKGRALVRFSRSVRAEEIYQDVLDGIRVNVSVGYLIYSMILEEENDGVGTYRVTDWEPLEVSFVSIPADITVGVGRSKEQITIKERGNIVGKENDPAVVTTADIEKAKEAARAAEQSRVREIMAIAAAHPVMADYARDFIHSEKSVEEFKTLALEKVKDEFNKKHVVDMKLSEKEHAEYSVSRAIMWSLERAKEFDGIEAEIHAQIEKQLGRSSRGVFVPMQIRAPYVAASGGQGAANTVATGVMDLISLLRNKMLVREMGATILSGLASNVAFPRQSGASTLYWTGENPGSDVNESEGTLDQVTLSPKTAQATTTYSRQLLLQSNIDVDNFVKSDLAAINAIGLDYASINGSGASNQPRGILNVSGIGSEEGGTNGLAPTWANIVNLERLVAVANADLGALGYLSNPKVRGKLKQTQKVATYGNDFIWEKGAVPGYGEMNGYKVGCTNQVPSNLTKGTSSGVCSAIIFGNWADLLIGEFGVLELIADPYAKKKQGLIEVTSFLMADIAVRHPESFAAMVDALTV